MKLDAVARLASGSLELGPDVFHTAEIDELVPDALPARRRILPQTKMRKPSRSASFWIS